LSDSPHDALPRTRIDRQLARQIAPIVQRFDS
jgi:hypothetical protein